jgi:acetyltransferase-like isoleucine patch superfamily enzyme
MKQSSIKFFIINLLQIFFKLVSFFYNYNTSNIFKSILRIIYSLWISNEFKYFGNNVRILSMRSLIGGEYITIGENTIIGTQAVITAWGNHGSYKFYPSINIGKNVSIGNDCHITSINNILIGDNVLMGMKVTITDNSHGSNNLEELKIPPVYRKLYSKGPVIIEDGVWIGDKVTILPNTKIGKNAIIGANAVVTCDIPPNCIAVGIPAKVIKMIK